MNIERIQYNNIRYYKVEGCDILLPSVTAILKHTKDQSGLDLWRNRVGIEVAKQIGAGAANRGTVMHKILEVYLNHLHITDNSERIRIAIQSIETDEETAHIDRRLKDIGIKLFYQIYNSTGYLETIKKVYLQEVFLWTKNIGGYAGTCDNASYLIDNKFKIIDFKSSKKPKIDKWIEDYKLQTSAYCIAIWERYGIKPDGAEIWISADSGEVQKFELDFNDIRKYFKMFKNRLKEFNDLYPIIKVNELYKV